MTFLWFTLILKVPNPLNWLGKLQIAFCEERNMMKEFIKTLEKSNTEYVLEKGKLVVTGNLDLSNTDIKELPKGLTVGESLYLCNTDIKELPKGLTVGGIIVLSM